METVKTLLENNSQGGYLFLIIVWAHVYFRYIGPRLNIFTVIAQNKTLLASSKVWCPTYGVRMGYVVTKEPGIK